MIVEFLKRGEDEKIYSYEPWFFIFLGIFHLHRIWGLVDRETYAAFWIDVMESKGLFYFVLMGILAVLCVLGMITFFRNLHQNYWWRWIYLCGVCAGMLTVKEEIK